MKEEEEAKKKKEEEEVGQKIIKAGVISIE